MCCQAVQRTHILPGDTGKLHRALDVGQGLAFDNNIVNILQDTSSNGTGVAGVGVEDLDDFLDSHGIVAGSPSVKVRGSADEGVTDFVLNNCPFGRERKMTYSSSASRASLASGMTDMLIMSPPHCRYIRDSARVEKAGPIASVSP